jgi:FtsP/CotA-like multicopper oxidase with cupredoxin domain
MRVTNMKNTISNTQILRAVVGALLLTATAYAASPGITGGAGTPIFNLTAKTAFLNQPDGAGVYSWGYGCNGAPAGFAPAMPNQNCPSMQVPGPTLIVKEGDTVTVNLWNSLPAAAGNTSILFPDFQVTGSASAPQPPGCLAATPAPQGLLTVEAANGCSVTYTFPTTGKPGTHAYYSGTQGDLQIEMGLYGAIIVLPLNVPANCTAATVSGFYGVPIAGGTETDFRLSTAAYDHPKTCYDREYMFQWAEMDNNIHRQALAQVTALGICTAGSVGCSLNVPTEPYHPAYFLINGRSMPDVMDPNYDSVYPHQPYNGNPHMHPGEQVLIRVIGQGRWQHPFHEHGNHVRILARDGNLLLTPDKTGLSGLLMFNTDTTPGQAFDGIFYWSARGLNWDAYGHHGPRPPLNTTPPVTTTLAAAVTATATTITVASGTGITANDALLVVESEQMTVTAGFGTTTLTVTRGVNGTTAAAHASGVTVVASNPNFNPNANTFTATANDELPCVPDANGYYTTASGAPTSAINYYEWCQDHNKPLEANPFGDVAGGGPATLPNPNIFTNGAWYGGTPYLGPDATIRASAPTSNLQPSNAQANPANERGFAFMWHSHNEREITTNNVFPGGMLMMMLVDSREFVIDESM